MSKSDLSLAFRLWADSSRYVAGLTQAGSATHRFAQGVKGELAAIRQAAGSVQGQLAQLGLGVSAIANQAQSARMDKGLTQIGQTAGMSYAEVERLRGELFSLAQKTGQPIDDLRVGFNNAVQSGLKFREALPVLDATNKAMAVTGASADRLTAGLTVAGTAFNFDLGKPALALQLLDKMTVAGRLGNAELQNLSDIFARVGVNAASAGLGFDKTLAFIETLSQVERQPERLATLADSTLRLFTNLKYAKTAAEATGVRFFDQKTGERRDPIAVLRDIKSQYDKLRTDKARALFMQKAFGEADLDTIKGLKTLFGGNALLNVQNFTKEISNAGGTIERDLPAAISNAVDQTDRLKNALRQAGDDFARPINEALQNAIQWGLDRKENGGLGLGGKDLLIGGALGAAGIFGAARYGGKGIAAIAGKFGGTAAGVAEGKVLEQMAGVTPVFVVNMPGGGNALWQAGGAGAGGAAATGAASRLALAGSAAMAVAPLAAMYGVSQWAGDTSQDQARVSSLTAISDAIKRILGPMGFNKDAEFAARLERNRAELSGEIRVRVDQDGRVASVTTRSGNPQVEMKADVGYTMVSP